MSWGALFALFGNWLLNRGLERLQGHLPPGRIGQAVFHDFIDKLRHWHLPMPGLVVEHADQESLDGGRVMLWSGHGDLFGKKME